jgi:hypothetical protein
MTGARRVPPVAPLSVVVGGFLVAAAGLTEWGRLVPTDGGDAYVVRGGWLVLVAGLAVSLLGIATAAARRARRMVVPALAALLLGGSCSALGLAILVDDGVVLRAAAEDTTRALETVGAASSDAAHDRVEARLRRDVRTGRVRVEVSVGGWALAAGGTLGAIGGLVVLGLAGRRGPGADAGPDGGRPGGTGASLAAGSTPGGPAAARPPEEEPRSLPWEPS